MKIKVCGFTKAQNARQAAFLGIDAIGLVFYPKSPRNVDISTANEIINALPPFINRVALFVNAKHDFIDNILNKVAIDTIQFHGDEAPVQCTQYNMPFIKAIRVKQDTIISNEADIYHQASALLLDSFSDTVYGGSGESFNWDIADTNIDLPIILAGGINANNASTAIKKINPYGIDLSSSVESAKGVKNIAKIRSFITSVKI